MGQPVPAGTIAMFAMTVPLADTPDMADPWALGQKIQARVPPSGSEYRPALKQEARNRSTESQIRESRSEPMTADQTRPTSLGRRASPAHGTE